MSSKVAKLAHAYRLLAHGSVQQHLRSSRRHGARGQGLRTQYAHSVVVKHPGKLRRRAAGQQVEHDLRLGWLGRHGGLHRPHPHALFPVQVCGPAPNRRRHDGRGFGRRLACAKGALDVCAQARAQGPGAAQHENGMGFRCVHMHILKKIKSKLDNYVFKKKKHLVDEQDDPAYD